MEFDKRALALTLGALALPACTRNEHPAIGTEVTVSNVHRVPAVERYGNIRPFGVSTRETADIIFQDQNGQTVAIRESNALNVRTGIKLDGLKDGDIVRVTAIDRSRSFGRYGTSSEIIGAEIVRK